MTHEPPSVPVAPDPPAERDGRDQGVTGAVNPDPAPVTLPAWLSGVPHDRPDPDLSTARSASRRLGDREGPLTHYQTAAMSYRRTLCWPTFAWDSAVWIRLPVHMAALRVDPTLTPHLPMTGPVITEPSGHRTLLTWCTGHAAVSTAGVTHVGYRHNVNLPPTEPLHWLTRPASPLPDCAVLLDAIARAS